MEILPFIFSTFESFILPFFTKILHVLKDLSMFTIPSISKLLLGSILLKEAKLSCDD